MSDHCSEDSKIEKSKCLFIIIFMFILIILIKQQLLSTDLTQDEHLIYPTLAVALNHEVVKAVS